LATGTNVLPFLDVLTYKIVYIYTNSAESTRGTTMVGAEMPESFWNFDSSRLAKSELLFF